MTDSPLSPLAPGRFPAVSAVAGVRLATAALGLKYRGRPDILLAVLDAGATMAGVFATSSTASAAVRWGRVALDHGAPRAIVVNAGNSIAFTGRAGDRFVERITGALSGALGCTREGVFVASTGVIGEPADPGPIVAALPDLLNRAAVSPDWLAAATAIGTTDTFPKGATATCRRCPLAGSTLSATALSNWRCAAGWPSRRGLSSAMSSSFTPLATVAAKRRGRAWPACRKRHG